MLLTPKKQLFTLKLLKKEIYTTGGLFIHSLEGPKSNAAIEQLNSGSFKCLLEVCLEEEGNWFEYLQYILFLKNHFYYV